MDRSFHIANCIFLLNNFEELKNCESELLYEIDNRRDRIIFFFSIKDLKFIIDLEKEEVYYSSQDEILDRNTLHLLYEIVDLFKKEFFSDEEGKQNETTEILF